MSRQPGALSELRPRRTGESRWPRLRSPPAGRSKSAFAPEVLRACPSSRSAREGSRARSSRGYSLVATSARIDSVAERFEAVLERLLAFAALELSVRRLASEIARTTRRMNALEHVVLPRLDAERAHISLVLEERELEDRVRLRRSRARGRPEGTRP